MVKSFSKKSFQLALLFFMTTSLYLLFSPVKAKADECSDAPKLVAGITGGKQKVQINSSFEVYLTNPANTKSHFSYQAYIKDMSTHKPFPEGGQDDSELGIRDFDFEVSSTGPKQLYFSYLLLKSDNTWCSNWQQTDPVSFEGVDNTKDSPNITINSPDKTDQGSSATISYNISNSYGNKFVLYINKGGDICSESSTDSSCWVLKSSGSIDSDEYANSFTWSTDSNTQLGRHAIRIKVFNPVTLGNESSLPLTDYKQTYTTICATGTANTGTCQADNGSTPTGDLSPSPTQEDVDITSDDIKDTNVLNGSKLSDVFGKVKNTGDLIKLIILFLSSIIGALSFIGILIGGVFYTTAGGDTAKAEKAKKTILYSILGLVLAALSWTIVAVIINGILNKG